MNGGSQIVGLWRDQVASGDQLIEQPAAGGPEGTPMIEPPPEEGAVYEDAVHEDDEQPSRPSWIAPAVFVLLALGWIGFVGWTVFASGGARMPAEAMTLIAVASPPLALLGVAWLLLMRTSRSEARRFGATAALMRAESAALEARVAQLAVRLDENRQALAAQSDQLLSLGEDATHRMAGVATAMRDEGDVIDRHAHTLQNSVTAARADMAVLLSSLPKAQVQTRQMVASIQEAGMGALEQAGALEAQLSSLVARGREADEIASGAAQRLAAHLGRMEGTSETAGARLEEAAGQMTGAVDAALARASEAVDEARKGMEAQGAAMLALVEQSKSVLERTGADTADDLSKRVAEINGQVEALGATLAAHDITGRALIAKLADGLLEVDARLAALDQEGGARAERLGSAISTLTDHAERLSAALDGNGAIAETLIGRAETLLTALDASAREIDETLPASLARLDIVTAASRSRVQAMGPELGTIESTAAAALDRLAQTEKLLIQQREAIDQLDAAAAAQLDNGRKGVDELAAALGAVDLQARALADGSGTQLIEVMLRVRDTAQQAAERAREALGKVVPEAAEALGQASADALREAVGDPIEQQMAALSAAAERAVESANKASDRLMREMLTISETTAAIESRFEESRTEAEEANRETFARRVSLLIESLNSTAIDVTKILSNDVTDSAWAAYLKGDRGVFTRRAVRLLDAGESREILRQYDEDPEFREQVNRYIHDFEAMLRNVLATREGSPLGVTLLSSDMGKLYVALAQAIERLRG